MSEDRAQKTEEVGRIALAYGVMIFTMIIWASSFAGIRYVLREISPMALTVTRLGIASVFLFGVALVLRVPIPRREDWWRLLWCALLGFSIYHFLLNAGAAHITAGQASFIVATIPIWTTLLAGRFLKETITGRTWLGLAIGLGGVGYMSLEPGDASVSWGSFLVLLCAVCAAGNMTLTKDLLGRYRAIDISIYATVIGSLPLLLHLPWTFLEVREMSITAWWVTIYLAVIPIGLGYWLSSIALSILPASRASQMLLLVPPIAAVIAWFFIGEVPSTRLFVGGPLIVAGVLVGAVRGRRRPRYRPPS
ncbi:MAG: DMT family transporter [Bradymonadaceae bacterium]